MSQRAEQLYDALLALSHFVSTHCCTGGQCEEFTLIDYLALRNIQQNPHCSIQSVGKKLGFTKSGATRVIKRLEARNLVSICVGEEDSRLRCLSLTQLAEDCLQSTTRYQAGRIEHVLDSMESGTSEQLLQGLQTLVHRLK